MKIYNTLTRKLENFKPLKDNLITFYQCGPTVYWVQHIGNLRAATWGDLIRRTLLYLNYQVKYVRNYTDVGHLTSDQDEGEDKMEKGAKKEGLTPDKLAKKYINIFEEDIKKLNILDPTYKPRATQYINQIKKMIQVLINKGYAYITNLAVVYNVEKFKNYNKLNRQKLNLNKKGSGHGEFFDPEKKHFADFNLWVFKKGPHKNALQTWPSPWGEGFPGWHIECSVMAKTLLGDTIDIHMGGVEHINIHHTNEIAQSEAANEKQFVRYWLHNEHLMVNGKKMAKSEGTGYTLQQIIDKNFNPMALRYFYLQAHYRSKQNFTWEGLKASQEAFNKLEEIYFQLKNKNFNKETTLSNNAKKYQKKFIELISNDFQIPGALALTWDMIKSTLENNEKYFLLNDFNKVFGLKFEERIIPQKIINLAEQRLILRKNKNFKKADDLRKKIESLGYTIKDTPDGYQIKKSI